MDVDVVSPRELGSVDRARWQALHNGHAPYKSPFLSPSFASAVSRARPAARVAILRDGPAAGFFPFEHGRGGHGRALGMGISDLQGLVAHPSLDVDTAALLRMCGLRSYTFDHLIARQRDRLATGPARVTEDFSRVVHLSRGYETWVAERKATSKGLLQSTARKTRKLEREHGPVRLVYDYPDHAVLERLLEWKSQQYRRTLRRDRFADPAMRSLMHDLLDIRDVDFCAPLSVLTAGDTMIAAHFGLRSRTTLAWWFPVYDTEFAMYSPGLILCVEMVRALADDGAALLDLGKGDEPYKERLSNGSIELLAGSVSATRHTQVLRTLRRWPYERTMSMVLRSPRLRHACRTTLARAGEARGRMASSRPGGLPAIRVPAQAGPPKESVDA